MSINVGPPTETLLGTGPTSLWGPPAILCSLRSKRSCVGMGPLLLEAWEECPPEPGLALRYLWVWSSQSWRLESEWGSWAHCFQLAKARDNQLSRETFLGQKLGLGPGSECKDQDLESTWVRHSQRQCCWLLRPFGPGNDPRKGKGCVQEGGQDTDSDRAGAPSDHSEYATGSPWAPAQLCPSPSPWPWASSSASLGGEGWGVRVVSDPLVMPATGAG